MGYLDLYGVIYTTKYSNNGTEISLYWCIVAPTFGRHIEVTIKPPNCDLPIGTINKHSVT